MALNWPTPTLLISLLILTGCSGPVLPPAGIGTNLWLGYEPLYLARQLNYFDEKNIRLVEYSSASQVIRGFRNGLLDVAALTLDEVLQLKQLGFDIDVILVMDISNGSDVIIATPDIQDVQALKGKIVGVENTALGAYLLERALELNGMTQSDIKIVPLEVAEHLQAFINNQVDALVTFDPTRARLLNLGARVIFDSTSIPNEIVDVLIVRHDYLEQHHQRIKTLIDDWFRALAFIDQQPAIAYDMMEQRVKLSSKEILAASKGLRFPDREENKRLMGTSGNTPLLLEPANKLAMTLLDKNLIVGKVEAQNLFSESAAFY